jgi:hypothetical protein
MENPIVLDSKWFFCDLLWFFKIALWGTLNGFDKLREWYKLFLKLGLRSLTYIDKEAI